MLSLMRVLSISSLVMVTACQTISSKPTDPSLASNAVVNDTTSPAPVRTTEVRDQAALERLRGNAGLTLQWIGWDKRGMLEVSQRGAVVHLKGQQIEPDGRGRLEIEGDVLSIDSDSFILRGQIRMMDTPDAGRSCIKQGDSEFAITQGRKYWRMREFEWCDGLTDYIDIYF